MLFVHVGAVVVSLGPTFAYPWAVSKRFARVGMGASFLVLLALFFMTVKP